MGLHAIAASGRPDGAAAGMRVYLLAARRPRREDGRTGRRTGSTAHPASNVERVPTDHPDRRSRRTATTARAPSGTSTTTRRGPASPRSPPPPAMAGESNRSRRSGWRPPTPAAPRPPRSRPRPAANASGERPVTGTKPDVSHGIGKSGESSRPPAIHTRAIANRVTRHIDNRHARIRGTPRRNGGHSGRRRPIGLAAICGLPVTGSGVGRCR